MHFRNALTQDCSQAHTDAQNRAPWNKAKTQRKRARRLFESIFLALCLAFGVIAPVSGENGLNAIGFGAESVLMGGADVAVARDTSALNTNPAGLANIRLQTLDLRGVIAKALDVSHADALGNDQKVSNEWLGVAGFGYAHPVDFCRCTIGIGGFVQGGAGYEYMDLRTPFGTRDELSSLLGIARLALGAGWQATDTIAVGLSVSALYARIEQRLFPSTSFFNPLNPAASFAGLRLDDASGVRPSARLGVQYRGIPGWTLGAVYAPRTSLPLTDGKLQANFTSIGLGTVTYRDARVDGFSQPQEAAVGAAWQATPALLLSAKLQWLDWSRALKATTLRGSDPDKAGAPATIVVSATHEWRDQWVTALGAAYQASDRLTWYGGVNYGRNPVPAEHLSPILAAILEWHWTAGLRWQLNSVWSLAAGVEYQAGNRATYTNRQSILGPNSTERVKGVVVPITLSGRW